MFGALVFCRVWITAGRKQRVLHHGSASLRDVDCLWVHLTLILSSSVAAGVGVCCCCGVLLLLAGLVTDLWVIDVFMCFTQLQTLVWTSSLSVKRMMLAAKVLRRHRKGHCGRYEA
jgi:hypothetical protein